MFNSIVLKQSEDNGPISVGKIAEALLYYQRVHVILDRTSLYHLIDQVGVSNLIEILSRPELTFVYCEEFLGVLTLDQGTFNERYNFVGFLISGDEHGTKYNNAKERLEFTIVDKLDSKKEAIRFSNFLIDKAPIRKYSGNHYIEGGIPEAAKKEFKESEYTRHLFQEAVKSVEGGFQLDENFKLEIISSGDSLFIFNDVDWARINHNRKKINSELEELNVAHILASLVTARADLFLASFYGGDFATSDLSSKLIMRQHAEVLRRANLNSQEIKTFTEVVMPDHPNISQVVNSKDKSIGEFLKLLDQAKKFKKWLGATNPDEALVRAYMKEISSIDGVQKLPVKVLRYLLGMGLDGYAPGAGRIAGFIDTFILDKMLGDWRPNLFVENKLVPFVSGQSKKR